MHSHLEQVQTRLWHDILRHRIEIAKRLIEKCEVDDSPEKSRLITLLRLDITKTRKALSV